MIGLNARPNEGRSTMRAFRPSRRSLITILALLTAPVSPLAGQGFSIEDILSPPFPVEMVSARAVDQLAWIAFERGMRNVYTATAPDFAPVALTHWMEDRGHDLTDISISDDGEAVVFVRGHSPNRDGWVANPNSDPEGAEEGREYLWRRSVASGGGEQSGPLPRWALGPFRKGRTDLPGPGEPRCHGDRSR